jgi:acid phosphatase (class A)
MKTLKNYFLLLALTLSISCAHKDPLTHETLDSAEPTATTLYYLSEETVLSIAELPAPPEPGGAQDQADLKEVLSLQNSRTPEQCARANTEFRINLRNFFGPKYGPLTAEQVTRFTPTFAKITSDARFFLRRSKSHFNRPRPFLASNQVAPCVPFEPTASYPSGHSAMAHLYALVLSDALPSLAPQIMKRADEIAEDRVLGGVHYPSDIAAGAIYANEIYGVLKKSSNYQSDIRRLSN